jgi:hypothetical protein
MNYTFGIMKLKLKPCLIRIKLIFHKHYWHYSSDDLFDRRCSIRHKYESWNNGTMEYN